MQPFRSDVDALEARHKILEAEVAERTRARDEAAQMLSEARQRARHAEIVADLAAGGPARRKRRAIAVVLGMTAVVIALVGLVRLSNSTPNDSREEQTRRVFAQFEVFADEACRCTSSACITELSNRMSAWTSEVAKQVPEQDHDKVDPTWTRRAQEIGERMTRCMTKMMSSQYAQEPGVNRPGGREVELRY